MAFLGAHDGAGRRGGRALLLGPPRQRQLRRGLAVVLACGALAALAGCNTEDVEEGPLAVASERDEIERVTDGDTVVLRAIGRARLIGIDTPEVFGRQECFGREASAFAKRVLEPGERVRVRLGVDPRDRFGRALVYLWLLDDGERMFNELLAERGYAVPLTVPPNVEYADVFVRAARRARSAGRGLWDRRTCAGDADRPDG